MKHFLFYLLLLFIPVQLGRHFFFDFTQISGIRSDYLTPTVYLTDIIALALIISGSWSFWGGAKRRLQNLVTGRFWTSQNDGKKNAYFILLLVIFCYLLFNVLFIAFNKWAAFYKFIKILEFILLGIAILRVKPKLRYIVSVLSIGVLFSSVLAIWQFTIQKSVGGIFWWLGERTFYAATPGIAAFAYNGNLLLRPYATFPHPNVLGGFLAVVLPLLLFYSSSEPPAGGESRSSRQARTIKKLWFLTTFLLGSIALILTFSRVAWLVTFFGLAGYFFERKFHLSEKINVRKEAALFIFYLFIGLSVLLPLAVPNFLFAKHQYWQERVDLIKVTIPMVAANLPFGIGLNNFIVQAQKYITTFPGLYIFQPVHNIYLLVLAETGLMGFLIFILTTLIIINKSLQSKSVFLYPFLQLLALGAFDHYLFTLQQGQLLFIIFAALTFIPKMAY